MNSGTPRTADAIWLDQFGVLFQKANCGRRAPAGRCCQGTSQGARAAPVCCRSRCQAAASASRASYLASSAPGGWGCSAGAAGPAVGPGAAPGPAAGSAPAGQCCSGTAAGSQGGSGGWKAGDVSFLFTVPHRRGVAGSSSTFTPKLQREETVSSRRPPPGCCSRTRGSHPRWTPTCKANEESSDTAVLKPPLLHNTSNVKHATGFGLSPRRDKLNVSEQTTQLHLETNTDDNEVRALRISRVNTDVSSHTRVAPHQMYFATWILFLSHTKLQQRLKKEKLPDTGCDLGAGKRDPYSPFQPKSFYLRFKENNGEETDPSSNRF